MTKIFFSSAAMLPIFLALTACFGEPETPKHELPRAKAHHTYLRDMSQTQKSDNPHVAEAIERVIGDDMKSAVRMNDRITYYETGSLAASNMIAKVDITTNYRLRVPAAHAKLVGALRDSAAQLDASGGDNATNLLASLEAIQPRCTDGSTVTVITDGLESGIYSAERALAQGVAVDFGEPTLGRYLSGCRIRFIAFGIVTSTATQKSQLLPSKQLAALRLGWLTYLKAAGVRPQDVEFISTM